MRAVNIAWLAVGGILLACLVATAEDAARSGTGEQVYEGERKAVERLLVAGAKITVDEKAPGRPAVEIDFFGSAKDFTPVSQLRSLRTVRLGGDGIRKEHLQHLAGLKHLESVELDCTEFGDAEFKPLSKLTQLRQLKLFVGLAATDKELKQLGKLKNLESLTVIQFYGARDAWLSELKGLEKLRKLDIDRMSITDEGVKRLSQLPALEELSLVQTEVTDKCLDTLKGMKKLKRVSLNSTKVTERGMEALRKARPDLQVDE